MAFSLTFGGIACTGAPGEPGAPGKDGVDGRDGQDGSDGIDGTPAQPLGATFTGTVHDGVSQAPAGAPVVAYIADLDGRKLASIGSAITDQNGAFSVLVNGFKAPSSSVVLEATLPSGTFHSYLSSSTPTISPVTEGVYRIVQQIVGSAQGRYTTDFTPDEFEQLVQASSDALQSNGIDLTDRAAVHQALLTHVGQRFVAASGGIVQTQLSHRLVVKDPPGDMTGWSGSALKGGGELWDINGYGDVVNGTNDSYDTMFELEVDGNWFPQQSNGQLQDERTVVLGPAVGALSGLDVTRKIFVPEDADWARFTEVLTNTGGTDVTVTVLISGGLGSDESIDFADYTSSGDQVVDGSDVWIVNNKSTTDPALGFLFPGAIPYKSGDYIEYQWDAVVVPAGKTVTLMHWAFQRSDKNMLNLVDRLDSMGPNPAPEYYEQAPQADLDNSLNAGAGPTILGEAGAFVPGETLTVTNQTNGASVVARASVDGSFGRTIPTASGDVIHISGDAGSEHTLTVF